MVGAPRCDGRGMRLTAWEEERLLIFTAAELARRHRDARAPPQRPRGDRAHLRRDAGGGPGRRDLRRGGGGGSGGGRLRTEVLPGVAALVDDVRLEVLMDDGARLVVLLDPLGPAERGRTGSRCVRAIAGSDGRRPATGRRRHDRPRRPQHVDPRHPGLVALPVRSRQPAARVRSRGGRRLPPGPAGGLDRAMGARRDADRPAGPLSAAPAGGEPDRPMSRLSPDERLARYGPTTGDRVRLGDTDLWVRGRGRPPGARRRADLGLRQDAPARDRPRARPSDSELDAVDRRRARARSRARRRQGRHRDQGRPDRRASGGRAASAISDGIELRDRSAHPADHGLRPDRDAGCRRQPRPPHLARAAARRAVRRRDHAHHRRLRGAALGDGAHARRDSTAGR